MLFPSLGLTDMSLVFYCFYFLPLKINFFRTTEMQTACLPHMLGRLIGGLSISFTPKIHVSDLFG